jgi:DNA-binding response OmpR family regulator
MTPVVLSMKRRRILIVEDDPAIRQLFRTELALAGFDVDTSNDGLSALHSIDETRPDLIVLDLSLPRVDGLDVIRELRASRYTWSIPVVVVTGSDHDLAAASPATTLRKPCSPEELLQVVNSQLRAA